MTMCNPNQWFSLSAKMNGTQRRILLRMHCTYFGMPKGTSRAEATSNSEKIKPIALAVIELCLTEGISQVISQSEENSVWKFHGNFLKAFQIDLKAYLDLVLPTPLLFGKVETWFLGDFTSWATPTSWSSLLWLLWFMILDLDIQHVVYCIVPVLLCSNICYLQKSDCSSYFTTFWKIFELQL